MGFARFKISADVTGRRPKEGRLSTPHRPVHTAAGFGCERCGQCVGEEWGAPQVTAEGMEPPSLRAGNGGCPVVHNFLGLVASSLKCLEDNPPSRKPRPPRAQMPGLARETPTLASRVCWGGLALPRHGRSEQDALWA